jgi:hypothetical protein
MIKFLGGRNGHRGRSPGLPGRHEKDLAPQIRFTGH